MCYCSRGVLGHNSCSTDLYKDSMVLLKVKLVLLLVFLDPKLYQKYTGTKHKRKLVIYTRPKNTLYIYINYDFLFCMNNPGGIYEMEFNLNL